MDREAIQERFGIIGSSAAIRNVIDRARQVARTDITVLIQGESGVGKELIAHAIHELSSRRHGPLIIVNCGAIPEGLIESELFGAEKGAYTGAVEQRSGYFEEADEGTIFLDEIGEMPSAAQVRLLRVLESGKFSRVGSSKVQTTDVRVLAATNKNLGREVEAGRFREDLYYRLSTVLIDIPPLRERKEDILPIFDNFVHRFSQKYNSTHKQLDDEAKELLHRYRWPGNVRELRNVAEQIVVLLRNDTVHAEDLRPYLRGVSGGGQPGELMPVLRRQQDAEPDEARERELIYRALLEMRIEVRELKEQIGKLLTNFHVAVPRSVVEREGFPGDYNDYVVLSRQNQRGYPPEKGGKDEDYASFIEDVAYEIEDEDEPVVASGNVRVEDETELETVEEEPLPTLEDAEQELIMRALKRFDGNRRQTAKALGISERTLYRKLKDLDEDL